MYCSPVFSCYFRISTVKNLAIKSIVKQEHRRKQQPITNNSLSNLPTSNIKFSRVEINLNIRRTEGRHHAFLNLLIREKTSLSFWSNVTQKTLFIVEKIIEHKFTLGDRNFYSRKSIATQLKKHFYKLIYTM